MPPSTDNYRDIFNQRGISYHKAMIEQPLARAQEFRLAVEKAGLREGQLVCDVPSGGAYLADFLDQDVDLVGVEYSRFFAFSRGGAATPAILAGIPELPLMGDCCDRVVSIAGLHHFHTHQKSGFFSEAFRVLGDQGLLLVADVNTGSPTAGFLDDFVGEHNATGHNGHYLDAGTPSMLQRCGFDLCEDKVEDYSWEFPDADGMTHYCRQLFGLEGVDSTMIRSGVREYLGYRETATACHMNWQLRYILAKKSR